MDLSVFLSDSTDSNYQTSSSVSTDTTALSQSHSTVLQQPPLNPIQITPSLNATPTTTPRHTPVPTSVQQKTQTSLTLPLSDTEFLLTPFNITPTHSPLPSLSHIPLFLILMILIPYYSKILTIQLHVNRFLFPPPSSLSVDVLNLATPFQFIHLVPIIQIHRHCLLQNFLKSLRLNRLIPFKRNLI